MLLFPKSITDIRCLAAALQRLSMQKQRRYLLPVPVAILTPPTPEGRLPGRAETGELWEIVWAFAHGVSWEM